MLQKFGRNERLEFFADYVERLDPMDFDMMNPYHCFAGHLASCFDVQEHRPWDGPEHLHETLQITMKQAYALYRWRVGSPRRVTPTEAAAKLRSLVKIKLAA